MKFRRLRTRIIVWVMGLSLALSLTLGALSCYGDYVSATEQVDTLLAASSEANALALHNYIDGLEREIVTIAASGGLTKTALSYEQRQDNLVAVLRARSDVSGLYTIGMDGISINDSDYTFADSSSEDYGEEEFFLNAASAEGLWMDDPVYDDWTDNISLTVTYRFNDGQGFDGVIGMDIHYQVLMDIISQGKVGDTGYSVMVNSEGRFIAHPDEAYVLNEVNYLEDTGTEPGFSSALATVINSQGDGQIKNVTLAGEEVSLYYHTLEETGWNLITIAKPAEFMGQFYTSLRTTLLLTAACILIAVLISLYIGNNIARPVSEMTKRMQSFAKGDLHSPMPAVHSRDEIGVLHDALEESTHALAGYVQDITDKLGHIAAGDVTDSVEIAYAGDFAPIKEQLNRILDALNDVMASVKSSAEGVKTTADQMSMAAGQLSENTVHQAGTIDTLSSAFGDIKTGIEHTAKSTTGALDKTSRAKQALTISRTSMDNMLTSMREIDNAAASIERIIKVIDDIAFQTNILALNAAVEAARAGQHGKGFAVVADEVRNLAGKSAESARQTGELISNTLRAVQNGTVTAGEAAAEMNGLDTLVEELAGLVQGIEKEANDQAGAAGSVYDGIERLSSIVQNDSAMAEETAAAGQEMRDMADTLYRSLSYFTLREDSK